MGSCHLRYHLKSNGVVALYQLYDMLLPLALLGGIIMGILIGGIGGR